MKGYISLLKGIKFRKNKKLNSLFLLKKPQEEKDNELNNNSDNLLPQLINGKNIENIKNIKNMVKEPKKVLKLLKRKTKTSRIFDDYEDLFFYLLKIPEKLELFEVNCSIRTKMKEKEDNKKEENNVYESESEDDFNKVINDIDINKIFYKRIYYGLIEKDKKFWENFYFPKAIYKIVYKKSRLKQKEILEYCDKYEMKYDSVINSYEKLYTTKTQKRNWDLDPISAYNNYLEIFNKDKNLVKSGELDNNLNNNNNLYEYEKIKLNKDIVIKTNNKGNGKTLIFDGKLLDVYVDDYFRDNYEKYIISINSPRQNKKEIIYDSRDFFPKLKQSFSFEKNITKKNKLNSLINQKSTKNMKTRLINMKINNKKNKRRLFLNDKEKNKENIFTINFNSNIQKNQRNTNKLFFSPDFSNNNNYQKTDVFFNNNEESPNLIFGKLMNKHKRAKRNLFNMFKFSYY